MRGFFCYLKAITKAEGLDVSETFNIKIERRNLMSENRLMADLLLPDVVLLPEDIIGRYQKRKLPEKAMVTRFAPSPTGMLHVGGIYAALVSERVAHQSGGVCYLRIEDTDRKREVSGSISEIINSLDYFGIRFDEGPTASGMEIGDYGPYKQSERAGIYKVFVKSLLERGLAYPCFCSTGELADIRRRQKECGAMPGYHGEWAVHMNITCEQAKSEIEKGKPYVIRLKSPGSINNKVKYTDLIKGFIEMPENDQDIVILKSDGLPTYHFAHAVDDFLMGATHVLRGDEWLSSVPVHLQLFDILGFSRPEYGHISPIMKLDGVSKRKFSKRKDLDGVAEYYRQQGYLGLAVIEYFMSLVNFNFEEWRMCNPLAPYADFTVDIGKMSASGALLDMNKLNDTSKDVVSKLSAEELYGQVISWTGKYDLELYDLMQSYKEYTMQIFNIGRVGPKPRKDIAKWSDIKPAFSYFYDELYDADDGNSCELPAKVSADTAKAIVSAYMKIFNYSDDKEEWFDKIRDLAEAFGFAKDMKLYRKNPELFAGNVGDVAMALRIALTKRSNTPDLYDVMQVMGKERVLGRLNMFIENFA